MDNYLARVAGAKKALFTPSNHLFVYRTVYQVEQQLINMNRPYQKEFD